MYTPQIFRALLATFDLDVKRNRIDIKTAVFASTLMKTHFSPHEAICES